MAQDRAPSNPSLAAPSRRAPKVARQDLPLVAILPFLDVAPDGGEEHVCEGIAEEILLALNRLDGLRVLSRTSSFLFKDANLPPEVIGRRLRAKYVVAGSLQREGPRMTLNAELVDVPSGTQLWRTHLDREATDIFTIVEDLASGLARALDLEPQARHRPPVHPEAYDDYLKGRQYYFRFNRHGMRFAIQMFQEAIGIDPTYAAAWAGLALCEAYLYIYVDRCEDHRARAEAASLKALELDPDLAEAHVSRGVCLSAAGFAAPAEEAFETALCMDPNLYEAYYFYARHCFAAGRSEEAIQFFEWAAALRPEDFQAVLLVAQAYDALGIHDEAAGARRRGLQRVEARLKHAPDDVRARYFGANALVALGEREQGLEWAQMARALDPCDSMLLYNLACIHALADDPEKALDCLTMSVAAGLSQKGWILHDGDLTALHGHPRFQELLHSLDA